LRLHNCNEIINITLLRNDYQNRNRE
jgi:hypothetical protein